MTSIEELAPLYVSGDLCGEERDRFEEKLASATSEDAALVESLGITAAMLTASGVPARKAPPRVKSKLMQAIRERGEEQPAWEVPHEAFRFESEGEGAWEDIPLERGSGRMKVLAKEREGYSTMLMEFGPDSVLFEHHHSGAEHCYVISGDLITHGRKMQAGDFFRAEPGSDHGESYTKNGCRVLVVAGDGDYR